MPFKRHQDSQTAGLANVAKSFDVPETQDSVAYGGNRLWDIILPNEAPSQSSPGQALTWEIPMSTAMTSIDESSLVIQGHYELTNNDGTAAGNTRNLDFDGNVGDKYGGIGDPIPLKGVVTQIAPVGGQANQLEFTLGSPVLQQGGVFKRGTQEYACDAGDLVVFTDFDNSILDKAIDDVELNQPLKVVSFTKQAGTTTAPSIIIDFGRAITLISGTNPVPGTGANDYDLAEFGAFNIAFWNGSTLTTPAFLSALAFDDLTIEINGTTVVPSQGKEQPYAVISNVIKNEPYAQREAGNRLRGYMIGTEEAGQLSGEDSKASVGTGANGAIQLAYEQIRRRMYMDVDSTVNSKKRNFELTYRLADAGLRAYQNWLPPGSTMRIRARITQGQMMQMDCNSTGVGYANSPFGPMPQFKLQQCNLLVARKELNEVAEAQLQAAWVERPMKVPFERVRTFIQFVTGGANSVNVVGALAGPTPKAVYAYAISMAAVGGNATGEYNPARLIPPQFAVWQDCRLSIGGARTYPVQPLTMGVSGTGGSFGPQCMSQLYQMYLSTCNEAPFLSSHNVFNHIQPVCFQIENKSDGFDVAEDVSVQFQGTLVPKVETDGAGVQIPIPNWALILVSFTDSVVEIDNSLETTVI